MSGLQGTALGPGLTNNYRKWTTLVNGQNRLFPHSPNPSDDRSPKLFGSSIVFRTNKLDLSFVEECV